MSNALTMVNAQCLIQSPVGKMCATIRHALAILPDTPPSLLAILS